MEERLGSFEEFWPFYVAQHLDPANRALHFLGTSLALGALAATADAVALVGARGAARRLRAGLGRPLPLREEQARHVPLPALVAARGPAHVRAAVARPDGPGARARARALPARGLSHRARHERGRRGAAGAELPRLADRGGRLLARAVGEAAPREVVAGRGREQVHRAQPHAPRALRAPPRSARRPGPGRGSRGPRPRCAAGRPRRAAPARRRRPRGRRPRAPRSSGPSPRSRPGR